MGWAYRSWLEDEVEELSPRQREILDFIVATVDQSGVVPSYREIGGALGGHLGRRGRRRAERVAARGGEGGEGAREEPGIGAGQADAGGSFEATFTERITNSVVRDRTGHVACAL